MYSRRKNGDPSRNKRLPKRYKVFEFLSSSCVQHTKVVLIWMMFLFLNYSTGMRVEYFWPGWLFLCSINESLRFEGLHFAFVFILIVLAIDLISFLVIPITWLFYLGSAYVWVYLLWHIDKGICFPTCILFMIFMYFEIEFRSKDLKCSNHSIYLFRPFAAHCIGYPAVCIGFSMKNYLEIKYKMRKKMDVRIQNETYYTMIEEALYPSLSDVNSSEIVNSVHDRILDEFDEKRTFNEIKLTSCLLNGDLEYRSSMESGFAAILFYPFTCPDTNIFDSKRVISKFLSCFSSFPIIRTIFALGKCAFYSNSQQTSSSCSSSKSYNNPSENEKSYTSNTAQSDHHDNQNGEIISSPNSNDQKTSSFSHNNNNIQVKKHGNFNTNSGNGKLKAPLKMGKSVDINVKLENTIKKLTSDLHSIKAAENQLRLQLSQIEAESKSLRENYTIQRQENELLSSEISKLSLRNKADKNLLNQLENQIISERKARTAIEETISKLESSSNNSDQNQSSGIKGKATSALNNNNNNNNNNSLYQNGSHKRTETKQNCTCGDEFSCRQKLKRLENDLRNMQIQISQRDDSLKMNNSSITKNAWQSTNGIVSKQHNLDEARKTLQNRINLATSERVKLDNKIREYNNLREELLAAYNKSHNSICELKNTVNLKNTTINQLQEKINHYETIQHTKSASSLREAKCKVSTSSTFDKVDNFYNDPRCDDPLFLKHQNIFKNSNSQIKASSGNVQQHLNHDSWGYLPSKNAGQSFNCFTNSPYENNQRLLSYKSISPPLNSNVALMNLHGSPGFEQIDSLGGSFRNHSDNHSIHDYMGSSLSSVLNQCAKPEGNDDSLKADGKTAQLFNSSQVSTQANTGGRLSGILSNFKNHNFSSPVLRQCAKNALLENYSSTDLPSTTINCGPLTSTTGSKFSSNNNHHQFLLDLTSVNSTTTKNGPIIESTIEQ